MQNLASKTLEEMRDIWRAATRAPFLALAALVTAVLCASLFAIEVRSLLGPIYGVHEWRQGWTYSVAYAFVHENASFFYPKHAWRGHLSGIVGMEAPVYPYSLSLLMRVFGDSPAIGRVLNFALFLLAFALFAKRLGQQVGSTSVLGYLVMAAFSPVALCEFRQLQPDPAMTSLALLAALSFHEHGRTGTGKSFLLGLALYTIALLTKPIAVAVLPAMFLFSVLGASRPTLRGAALRFVSFVIPVALMFAWDRWANVLKERYMEGQYVISIEHDPESMWANVKDVAAARMIFLGLLENWVTHVSLFPAVLCGIPYSLRRETRSWSIPMLAWSAGMVAVSLAFASRYWANWYYMTLFVVPILFFGALGLGRLFEVVGKQTQDPLQQAMAFALVGAALLIVPLLHDVPWSSIEHAPAQDLAVHVRQKVSGSKFYWIAIVGSILGAATLMAFRDALERLPKRAMPVALSAAFAWSMIKPYKDVKQTARWATGEEYWEIGHTDDAEIRRAVNRYSKPDELFVMNGSNPALLVRALRVGYADDPGWIDRVGRDFYVSKGVRFFMDFWDSPGIPTTMHGIQMLERGARWGLYCIDPKGCPALCKP